MPMPRTTSTLMNSDYTSTVPLSIAEQTRMLHELQTLQRELDYQEEGLRSALEACADGLLLVDGNQNVTLMNGRFAELWHIPPDVLERRDDAALLAFVSNQLTKPEEFMAKVRELYAQPEAESFDTLKFRDGRVYERYSRPQRRKGQISGRVWSFRDVTERKRLEESLQENKTKYESLIETTQTGYVILDANGCVQDANQEYARLTGRSLTEIYQRNLLEWTAPHDLERNVAEVKKCIEHGYVRNLEMDYISPAGKICPVEINATVLRTPAGTSILTLCRDITARKQVEQRLRDSEFLVKESQRAANIGSYQADFVADAWESSEVLDRIFGIDKTYRRTVEGWLDILHPADRERVEQYLKEEVASKHQPFNKEYRIIRKSDGQIRWVQGLGETTFDTTGRLLSLLGTIQDITDRKRVEEELRSSEAKYRVLHESMRDAFVSVDMEGRLQDFNSVYQALLGYSEDELRHLTYVDLTPVKWHAVEAKIVAEQVIPYGYSDVYEKEYRRKDGTVFPVELRTVLIRDTDGKPTTMCAIIRDITERKRGEEERVKLQSQLSQVQKMETVGRLAGGVAHDFNNMMGIVLGFTELALMDMAPGQPLFSDLQEIQKAAQSAADLTRQLLAFARKQTVEPKILDLNETVEGMLKMLRHLIRENKALVWNSGASLPPIKMDPSQIDQLLVNLCANARDAIAGVGKVTLETKKVIFDDEYCSEHLDVVPGEYVLLAVSDNGCGMDPEILPHIFEPFFTTKGVGKGSGLGLATVYGIVKQNNGFIQVRSEPGQGTTFSVFLPAHQGKAAQRDSENLPIKISRGHETVLLVEDEPALLDLGKITLESLGYRVLVASAPSDAIRLAAKHAEEIQLLLTDMIMPEMTGRDLARRLLALNPNLKCLFMSGYAAEVIASQGVIEDGLNFLQKPCTRKDLGDKVRLALDR
jgi:PAS domain S-box-containing protein